MRPELTYPADVATHVFCSGRVICSEEKVHKDAFRAREVGLWVPRAGSQMFPGASSTNRPSDRLDGITAGDDGEVLRAIQHMKRCRWWRFVSPCCKSARPRRELKT